MSAAPGKKQIQLQPSKSELPRNASRRDKLKPYVLEPPIQAQRFPKHRYCDVYPWKGNHPEDRVTDAQAKSGQCDKLQYDKLGKTDLLSAPGLQSHANLLLTALQNEQASAQSPMVAAFKQRGLGLRSLSSLYLAILEKRQSYSAITAPSTFKPPPRVTLPDQKREAWLRDLANPLVPLRRLSRTIPHGLKGPTLLEQCATKCIPAARAVWFVRCVGANELRGLKRKGVGSLALGGEAKWIKEWTGQVVQFLEKSVGPSPGTTAPDDLRRMRMHYSMRLATHLYAESLLDRIGFLDWLLSFLESCSLDQLPLAAVLAATFWDDLLKLRRFARRLAEVLVAKYEAAHDLCALDPSYAPLVCRFSVMASDLLFCHRESLVWSNDSSRLQQFLSLVDSRFMATRICLGNLSLRNNYFICSKDCPPDPDPATPIVSNRRKAISYLDAIEMSLDTRVIYRQLNTLLSVEHLVLCVFEWAVTALRSGRRRVYLGAELLRLASLDGSDIQALVMDFLGRLDVHTKVNPQHVYLLVSELVRTDCFSIAIYMRWLIAKGGLSKIGSLKETCPCYVRLLAEIPMHSIPSSLQTLRNLRNTLLSSCSFDWRAEEKLVITIREMLSTRGIFGMPCTSSEVDSYPGLNRQELGVLRGLSRTAKSELAQWIKKGFEELMVKKQVNSLPVTQVILMRDVLEQLGDIPALLDIIKVVLASDNWEVLTLVADTMNYNNEVFSVLHPFAGSLQQLYLKYKKLQSRPPPVPKEFIMSFLELLGAAGVDGPIRRELASDLAAYDRRFPRPTSSRLALLAHSPISEPNDDDMLDEGEDVSEEICRLWTMGAKVHKAELSRMFETTVSKLETSFMDVDNQSHILSAMTKLRQLDPQVFDEHSQRWVFRMQSYSNRLPHFRAFSSLIAGSCLGLDRLANVALNLRSQHNGGAVSALDGGMFLALVLELMLLDDPFGTWLPAKNFYTLKLKCKSFVSTSPTTLLRLFRDVFELCSIAQNDELDRQVLRLISTDSSLEFLRGFATQNLGRLKAEVIEPLAQSKNPTCITWLQHLVDNLLDDSDSNDNSEIDSHVQVARLLDLADDFSISLCKLKMQIILGADPNVELRGNADAVSHPGNTIARSFVRGFASASQEKRKICADLITVLNKDYATRIRSDVEELFLEWNNFLKTQQLIKQLDLPLFDDQEAGESLARAFLSVIEATSSTTTTTTTTATTTTTNTATTVTAGSQFIPSLLVERMVKFIQAVSVQDGEAGSMSDLSLRNHEAFSEFRCWFLLFMKLIVLHRAAFTQARSSTTDQARMLAGLCCLLQRDITCSDEAYFELIMGVASNFCDDLPDDTRAQLKRYARGKRTPAMKGFLLGSGDTAESLKALQKGKLLEFAVKPWERLAEPTPNIGENDVSLSLRLFRARKV